MLVCLEVVASVAISPDDKILALAMLPALLSLNSVGLSTLTSDGGHVLIDATDGVTVLWHTKMVAQAFVYGNAEER